MSLIKTIDKVLAAFGNIRAMERTHVDTYTESLITNIKGVKIAESEFGQLFVSFQNLANYEFLNATILSGTNIKTLNGGSLTFILNNNETIFISDTKEIESDYSNVSNRWLTNISFVISNEDKKLLVDRNFDKVLFKFKKKILSMHKFEKN